MNYGKLCWILGLNMQTCWMLRPVRVSTFPVASKYSSARPIPTVSVAVAMARVSALVVSGACCSAADAAVPPLWRPPLTPSVSSRLQYTLSVYCYRLL